MAGRLSETERAELVARAERLRLELRLVEAELRSDAALRVRATGPGRGRAAPERIRAVGVFAEAVRRAIAVTEPRTGRGVHKACLDQDLFRAAFSTFCFIRNDQPTARIGVGEVGLPTWKAGKPGYGDQYRPNLAPPPVRGFFQVPAMKEFTFETGLIARVRVSAADEASAWQVVPNVIGAPAAMEIALANRRPESKARADVRGSLPLRRMARADLAEPARNLGVLTHQCW